MQKMRKRIEGAGNELFICFTSRPSAASSASTGATTSATMRIPSSKSLMSPNRSSSNSSIPSLSSSLSCRLRSSGSIKGGQSPMFPAAGISVGRKKGAAFEAAEPSSPKVTCIGQVRVKSKKRKGKNSVARSRSGREASFRRSESSSSVAAAASRRRKTVSICDALRSFGSEMNCFVPCGWSCSSRGDEETTKRAAKRRSSSCGAVFARCLMAIEEEEGEDIKGREFLGLVVREKEVEVEVFEKKVVEEEEVFVLPFHSRKEEILVVEKEKEVEEVEKGRVSVCVPPRNALLLMRCRSDPVRMAALANRFWDSPAMRLQCKDEEEEEEEVDNEESEKADDVGEVEEEDEEVDEAHVEEASLVAEEVKKDVVVDEKLKGEDDLAVALEEEKTVVVEEAREEEEKEGAEILDEVVSAKPPEKVEEVEEAMAIEESIEKEGKDEEEGTFHVQRGEDEGEEIQIVLRRSISCSVPKSNDLSKAKECGRQRSFSYREKKEKRRHSFSTEREAGRPSFCSEKKGRRSSFSVEKEGRRRCSFSTEKENLGPKEKPKVQTREHTKKGEKPPAKEGPPMAMEAKITEKPQTQVVAMAAAEEREKIQVSKKEDSQVVEREKMSRELPDCLLLMMYEPKLSMEVSKETWVCSTDFLRWRPNYSHQANQPPKSKGNAEDDGGKTEEKCAESMNMIAVTMANPAIARQTLSKPQLLALSPIDQKLLKSPGIGPLPQHFVLTRCKSEPVRSSARLAPESCFWKSRHQPIGTAGVGF